MRNLTVYTSNTGMELHINGVFITNMHGSGIKYVSLGFDLKNISIMENN